MKKYLVFLLATLMLLSLVAGCGNTVKDDKTPDATERTLVIHSDAIFTTLNFMSASGYGDKFFGYNVYECLALPGKEGGMELQLAESYEISTDGLTYTIKLPANVKFHNGATVINNQGRILVEYGANLTMSTTKAHNGVVAYTVDGKETVAQILRLIAESGNAKGRHSHVNTFIINSPIEWNMLKTEVSGGYEDPYEDEASSSVTYCNLSICLTPPTTGSST